MKKVMCRLLNSERGLDLIKCFYDMSLKDASIICKISFSTMRLVKGKRAAGKWFFQELRSGKINQNKWDEIKEHREAMMKDEFFVEIKEILERAAKRGALLRKLCVGSTPTYIPERERITKFVIGMNERANQTPHINFHYQFQSVPTMTEPVKIYDEDHILSKVWALAPSTDLINKLAKVFYSRFKTPGWIWNNEEDFFQTLHHRVPSEPCCTLLHDTKPVVLPRLEPITDWGWLERMGLRGDSQPI